MKVLGNSRGREVAILFLISDNVVDKKPCDHHTTRTLSMKSYDQGLMNGYWHNLRIALKDFYATGMAFDPAATTQIILGTWNDKSNFTFFLDDITLTKSN